MAVSYFRRCPRQRVRFAWPLPRRETSAGDVGYVPQGYGHSIENVGTEDVELLIVLNNGNYEAIELTAWVGGESHLLLATNFKLPEATFKDFLTHDRFMPG